MRVSLSQLCGVGLSCVRGGPVLADQRTHAGVLLCGRAGVYLVRCVAFSLPGCMGNTGSETYGRTWCVGAWGYPPAGCGPGLSVGIGGGPVVWACARVG